MHIDDLVGEVLTHIDVAGDEIMLTTQSGRQIKLLHYQDCCESVYIESIEGDFQSLIGKPILLASHEEDNGDVGYESCTKTKFTFKTDENTVISNWIGTSNGYYSESVSVEEIVKKQKIRGEQEGHEGSQ